ncbi:MAG TPA: DNA (cytosine-5-)-methyltransferase [Puia sp.]|nr:DNA (cytosine-5-)-methyltransferase [Puia sp.]
MAGKTKKKRKKIIVVDLFCGVGGLSHGFVLEGMKVAAGVDLDPACEYAYKSNNNGKFVKADISDLTGKDLNKLFNGAQIKVLAGCAPCQPFSSYAHRYDQERDNKWNLLGQFSRLVRECKPQIVTMENVPALRKHPIFATFVSSLKRQGYKVWYDVVDSSLYGVPQIRKRLVLLASKYDKLELIPSTAKTPFTVKKAIGNMPSLKAGQTHEKDRIHTAASLSEINLKRIKVSKPGGTWKDWPKAIVAKCHQITSGKTYPSVYGRMKWDGPAPTMTTQCYGYGNGRFGHPQQHRAISLREAAILQSFPRHYKFIDRDAELNLTLLGRLIGNAVPVKLGRAIAKSISRHLKERA